MKIRCKYCDNYMDDTDETCPHCGGVNTDLKRVGDGVPTTIEELKLWYKDHNLPDEKITRFFIGKDIKEPKAFGIYYNENTKKYTVYKNKANGQRAIRYEGKDEKYAVNELYLKLKEEIFHQKSLNANKKTYNIPDNTNSKNGLILLLVMFIIFTLCIIVIPSIASKPNSKLHYQGYYLYKDTYYYLVQTDDDYWYKYNKEEEKWELYDIKKLGRKFNKHKRDYYEPGSYKENKFESSGYYLNYCDEGLRYIDSKVYYIYDGSIYEYKDGWKIIKRKDYDKVDLDLRKYCNEKQFTEPNNTKIKQDFRSTSYYKPKSGYYIYQDTYYYYFKQKEEWYKYEGSSWIYTKKFSDLYYLYYATSNYYSLPNFYLENNKIVEDDNGKVVIGIDDFTTSSAYHDYYYNPAPSRDSSSNSRSWDYDSRSSWDSDWDSGSSWDSSDSWDSGGTDWGSDW